MPALIRQPVAATILLACLAGPLGADPAPRDTGPAGLESGTAQTIQIPMTLLWEGLNLGQVGCILDPADGSLVGLLVQDLDALAGSLLDPALRSALAAAGPELGPRDLETLGLGLEFDPANLVVALRIPVAKRSREAVAVLQTGPAKPAAGLVPELFSAWLNLFTSQRLAYSLELPDTVSWAADLNLEAAFNLGGWVLEVRDALSTVTGVDLPELSLVKEFSQDRLVLEAGDYEFQSRGFLEYGAWQGAMVRKTGRHGFSGAGLEEDLLLDEAATVDVYVNSRLVRTLQLPTGRYSLAEFAVGNGINQVELRVHSASGQERTIRTILPEESEGLAPGEDEFAYALGMPAWDPSDIVFSAWHAYGFTRWFTGGLGARISTLQADAVLGLLFPSPAGTFSLDGALRLPGYAWSQLAGAVRAGWSLRDNSNPWVPALGLGGSWTAAAWNPAAGSGLPALGLWASISQHLGEGAGLGLRLDWQTYHDSTPEALGLGLQFNAALSPRVNFNLGFSTSLSSLSLDNTVASLQVQIHEPAAGATFNLQQDLIGGGTRADLQHTSLKDGLDFALGFTGPSAAVPDGFTLDAALHGAGNRLVASAAVGLDSTDLTGGELVMDATLGLAGALVFAGGHLAISRPVSDSFALVVPQYDLAGKALGVNPDGTGYEATTDLLGPPVLARMPANVSKRLNIEMLDPADPVFVRNSEVVLAPTYRSGIVVPVGAPPEILVTARLVDAFDQPLANQAGELLPAGGTAGAEGAGLPFFTDEAGVALMYGLTAGIWQVRLGHYPPVLLDLQRVEGGALETRLKFDQPKEGAETPPAGGQS